MTLTNTWKPVKEFPNDYLVSDDGRVFSLRKRKELRPAKDKYGYLYYVLCVKGVRKTIKAHRLVAEAFMPNPDNKPTVDHINTIRTDNRVENLRWASLSEQWNNEISRERHLSILAEINKAQKGVVLLERRKPVIAISQFGSKRTFNGVVEAAIKLNLNAGKVSECANGKRKTTGGYRFIFLPESED